MKDPRQTFGINSFHIVLSQFYCIVYFLTEATYMHCNRFSQRFSMVKNCMRQVSAELSAFRGCFVSGKDSIFHVPQLHVWESAAVLQVPLVPAGLGTAWGAV